MDVITDAGGLTAEWLGAALGRSVRAVSREPIGTGQMGSSWRLTLDYDGEAGPATLVAKLAAGDDDARAVLSLGFRKELGFYQHLAPTLDVRVPRCWYAAITDGGADFTLLLEDLTPARPGVQVDGCSVGQATGAVRNLAALHAPRWNDRTLLDHEFLGTLDPDVAELYAAAAASATDPFLERYADTLADDDVATLRASAEVLAAGLARVDPFTVVHGDYRLDNLMFSPTGADVVALDWQSVGLGSPGRDVAYLIGTAFEAEERRRHEDGLLQTYHADLLARGVTGYSYESCREDYRVGHLQGPMVTMLGAIYATAARSAAADAMFMAMARRSCAAIRDLGTIELVKGTT